MDGAVVYDDRDIASIIARILEKIGHQVEGVSHKRGTLSGLGERGLWLAVLAVKTADANAPRRLEAIREAHPRLAAMMNRRGYLFEILYVLPIINPVFTPVERLSGIFSEETSGTESK